MHDYTIVDHSRANVGRWLGLISLLFSFSISYIIAKVGEISQFNTLAGFTVSSGVLYVFMHYLFNNFLWRKKWASLPDIQGIWSVSGKTMKQDGNVIHKWTGELDIEQKWERISIVLKTEQSCSKSYTATLRKEPGSKGGWVLHYSYQSEPNVGEQNKLSTHKGFCEIVFSDNTKVAKGNYFNNYERYTFGEITLDKER